jgi:hypothetical protein
LSSSFTLKQSPLPMQALPLDHTPTPAASCSSSMPEGSNTRRSGGATPSSGAAELYTTSPLMTWDMVMPNDSDICSLQTLLADIMTEPALALVLSST